MIKPTQKTREYTRNDLIKAIGATILCLLVVVFTSIIKFYIIGQPVSSGIWSCILTLSVMIAIFMGGLLMFVLVARTEMIKNVKSYLAHLTVVTVTFVIHLFVSIISPLLMLPGLSAMVILQISRQKHDAFIFNLLETMMIMCVLLLESVMTEGEVLMLIGGGDGAYLWYLGCISLVGVGSGAFLPLLLQNKTRRVNYLIVGFFQMLASAIIFVLTLLVCDKSEIILTNFWMPMLASALTVIISPILFPIIEGIFNLVTENRLIELTNSSQPLLRKLAIEAPGTYNHSLTVSNFAEMCATAIGEDPYLARAAAYYHDIGKLTNPSFFAENQSGYNPHDDLLPEVSAEIIRNHTTDGYQILKASRIPEEIAIVAIEHQGTLPITVFYNKAKALTDGDVDVDEYRYHGATPTSKIAGIIMICDSSEAAIRAMDKPDGEKINALLTSIINERIQKGQFDNCELSLQDIDVIKNTIIDAFGGVFHQRVKYPGGH